MEASWLNHVDQCWLDRPVLGATIMMTDDGVDHSADMHRRE